MTRKYELKERARRQAETRQRIVEAAVDLHTSLGPARTTISAIAERAGVERHTVYAHFPGERELFAACSQHWRRANPFPDADAWDGIADPKRRLRVALDEIYAWYEAHAPEIQPLRRDAASHALSAEYVGAFDRRVAGLARDLAASFGRGRRLRAAVGHALQFETWRSLTRQGLTRRGAVELMVRFVASV